MKLFWHIWVSSHCHLIRQNKTAPHRKCVWGFLVLHGVAWKEASLKWLFWLVYECILEWKALIITHCYIQPWLTFNPHGLHRNNTYINSEFWKVGWSLNPSIEGDTMWGNSRSSGSKQSCLITLLVMLYQWGRAKSMSYAAGVWYFFSNAFGACFTFVMQEKMTKCPNINSHSYTFICVLYSE